MKRPHSIAATILGLCVNAGCFGGEIGRHLDFYGSINVGLEYRHIGGELAIDDHFEIQDAYSRLGIKGDMDILENLSVFFDYALAIDTTTGRLGENNQTSWEGPSDVEENWSVVGINGAWGIVSVGRMYNEYYNRISYVTDHFSSGWTGFNTYGDFQRNRTLTYVSPDLQGFSFGFNWIMAGPTHDKGDQDRYIATASYTTSRVIFSIGYDNLGDNALHHSTSSDMIGLSLSTTQGPFVITGKYERLMDVTADAPSGKNRSQVALLIEFQQSVNTYKLMFSDGNYAPYLGIDNEGKASEIALGLDHMINDNLYLFTEYHGSNQYCAYDLSQGNGNGAYTTGKHAANCDVFSAGVHFNF